MSSLCALKNGQSRWRMSWEYRFTLIAEEKAFSISKNVYLLIALVEKPKPAYKWQHCINLPARDLILTISMEN